MAAGIRCGPTLAGRLPSLRSPADVGRAEPFPYRPVHPLDQELEGNMVAAGHTNLPCLDRSEHARRPVIGDTRAPDDHEFFVVLSEHPVNSAAGVAQKIAVLNCVLADE